MRYRTLVCASLLTTAMLCVPFVQVTAADAMNEAIDRTRYIHQDVKTVINDRTLSPTATATPAAAADLEAAPSTPGGIPGQTQGVKSVRNGLRVDTDEILSR